MRFSSSDDLRQIGHRHTKLGGECGDELLFASFELHDARNFCFLEPTGIIQNVCIAMEREVEERRNMNV